MALPRREVELTVERPIDPAQPGAGSVRLSARFETDRAGGAPSHAELAEALERLRGDLDALLGPPIAAVPVARPDRETPELVETYRPRTRSLVDALRDDGELSSVEHERLVAYLGGLGVGPVPIAAPPPAEPTFDRPIAAVPIAADRSPEKSRAVPELLERYQITSLKQAGAVRARREISFEEYMALKRHFQREEIDSPRDTG